MQSQEIPGPGRGRAVEDELLDSRSLVLVDAVRDGTRVAEQGGCFRIVLAACGIDRGGDAQGDPEVSLRSEPGQLRPGLTMRADDTAERVRADGDGVPASP